MRNGTKVIISLFLILAFTVTAFAPMYAAGENSSEIRASALKQLRLFKGVSADNFDLDRAPTRAEALVMLIRVLGKEQEALNGSWKHPFTDVEAWANKYIGYAYEKGLTKGISATEFGTGNADAYMYLTFILRSLGYDDSKGDFKWDEPETLASKSGILSGNVNIKNFKRADAVLISWAALDAKLKDGSQTLSQKLIGMKLFTSAEYDSAKIFVDKNGGVAVSTAAEFETAINNDKNTVIRINSNIDIKGEIFADREENHDTVIYIKEGVTLTISGKFTAVGCYITNDGSITVSGTFDRGLNHLTNNGSATIKKGGTFCSGMTDTYNYGNITVDTDGKLLIERGTQFYNRGKIANNGYISVNDGGNLDNTAGAIVNNGTIDIGSFFNGKLSDITGTGTVKDNRN